MHYERHIIYNFPKNYPLWKKILANIIFFFGGTIIHPRKNLLKNHDLREAKKVLKKGDIVLVGGLRRFSSLIIKGPLTHSMMYIGHRGFIHSIADGVEIDNMHSVFCEYDTMLILRSKCQNQQKINKAVTFALSKIGHPFDFEFKDDQEKFYCSELLNSAFKYAKIENGLPEHGKKSIHPKRFINKNFKAVFISHNLTIKNFEPILIEQNNLQKLQIALQSN